MFEDFALSFMAVNDVTLRVRHGGSGPPVLLVHGHPRTHVTWHKVAPLLAKSHTVVCPDSRGYGKSSKPKTTSDHGAHSKRATANDFVALMRALGHGRFAVVGHDRGAYVATRLALDHPNVVSHLIAMDGVPIAEALDRCDAKFAQAWWHWFFLGQPGSKPERAINVDPEAWYGISHQAMGEEAWADLRAAIHDPATVHAMCEDYRAGLTIDREHDEQDRRAGRRIQCPTLVLWALEDDLLDLYGDVLGVWRNWADDLSGFGIDSGHHMAEEAPDDLAARLLDFLGRSP